MNYTAEHIDPEKFEAGLEGHKRYQEEVQRTTIEKANARYEGYCQCLEDVRSMLHCSNYEKTAENKETPYPVSYGSAKKSYIDGVNDAFYELCKELGIGSQDIRDMNTSVDQKAYMIAERIKETLCGDTPGKINWVSVEESLPAMSKEKLAWGDREIKVLVWDGSELDKASYLPGLKNFFDLADEPICGVTHWAIFDPPKK